jgi:hypothetical protein
MPPPSAADVAAAQSPGLTDGDLAVTGGPEAAECESPPAGGGLAEEQPIAPSARTAVPAMNLGANRIDYLA